MLSQLEGLLSLGEGLVGVEGDEGLLLLELLAADVTGSELSQMDWMTIVGSGIVENKLNDLILGVKLMLMSVCQA